MKKDKPRRITKDKEFNLKRSKFVYRLSFICTALVAFSIIFGSFIYIYKVTKEVNVSKRRAEAATVAHEVEYYLMKNMEKVSLIATNVDNYLLDRATHKAIENYLIQEHNANTRVADAEFLSIYGYVRDKMMDGSGFVYDSDYNAKERPWYTEALKGNGEVILIPPYIDVKTGKTIVSFAKLLSDGESVVAMDMFLDHLQSTVESFVLAGTGHLLVTDQYGNLVACEDKRAIGRSVFKPRNDEERALSSAIYDIKNSKSTLKFDGVDYLFFSEKVANQWNVVMLVDKQYMLGNTWFIMPLCILINAFAIGLIVLFFMRFNQRRLEAEENNIKLSAVADIYICMYDINLLNATMKEIKSKPYIKYVLDSHSGNIAEVLSGMMDDLAADESKKSVAEFVNLETVNERLKDCDTITHEFRGIINYCRARFIVQKRDALDNVIRVLFLIENIGAEISKRKELIKVANTDVLTQMPNRRAWDETLSEKREKRELEELTVCTLDVNGLKAINDKIGHFAGDELLIGASNIIKQYFSQYGEVFRIGGDEFAFITDDITPRKDRMRREFLKLVSEWKGKYCDELSISIGIARGSEENADNVDDLVKIADKYMYEDKSKHYEKQKFEVI